MSCPICVSPEGSAISDGIRAGAGLLIVVTTIVIGIMVRFAYRLWTAEGTDGAARASAVAHD